MNNTISTFLLSLFTLLLCCSHSLVAQSVKASVSVLPKSVPSQTVPHELFGGFIEFIWDAMNGPFGMCAEEIMHRGFDLEGDYPGVAARWQPWHNNPSDSTIYTLEEGGYNERGKFGQIIRRSSTSDDTARSGVEQEIVINGKVTNTFYVYARGTAANVRMELYSINGITKLFSAPIEITSDIEWKKAVVKIPILPYSGRTTIVLSCSGAGRLELDEASLMPDDNIAGFRKEYADFFKEIAPPVLRYPGGCFSDQPSFHWQYGVGDRDKRASPLMDWVVDYQRMDFGTDEYMKLCEYIGTKPQLTVNFGSGTPQEAADYIEYCNGDKSTPFGGMRAVNGHPEPYNVKLVEIGNEQYGAWEIGHTTPKLYAEQAIKFAQAVKSVSPDIKVMFNGNAWDFGWNDTVISTAKNKIDIFSIHYGTGYGLKDNITPLFWYTLLMTDSHFLNSPWVGWMEEAMKKAGLPDGQRIAITEWWHIHNGPQSGRHDKRFGSLQSGVWNALQLMHFIKQSHFYTLANRTYFVGMDNFALSPVTGERIFYINPDGYSTMMLRPFSGGQLLPSTIQSPTYSFQDLKDIPYLDAVIVQKQDSFYVSLVNRHPDSSISVSMPIDIDVLRNTRRTTLSAEHYTTLNEPSAPYRIVPVTDYFIYNGFITLPPHSLTVLAFRRASSGVDSSHTATFNAVITPQPAGNLLDVTVSIPESFSTTTISIIDKLGKEAMQPVSYLQTHGTSTYSLNTDMLPPGYYNVKISTGYSVIYRPCIIVR